MSKVTVVGAGNVGATCANVLAFNEVADEVVMQDVKEGVSEGKAMDMMQTAQLLGFDTTVVGCTNDYAQTANSDVVVITSGAINERTLDWIVQLVFDFTKKRLEDYMAKKSAETTTVAHFGNVGENKRND